MTSFEWISGMRIELGVVGWLHTNVIKICVLLKRTAHVHVSSFILLCLVVEIPIVVDD